MALSSMFMLKKLAVAHKLATGAVIGGAIVGVGLTAGAMALACANKNGWIFSKNAPKPQEDPPAA